MKFRFPTGIPSGAKARVDLGYLRHPSLRSGQALKPFPFKDRPVQGSLRRSDAAFTEAKNITPWQRSKRMRHMP